MAIIETPRLSLLAASAIAALAFSVDPAQALVNRAWVSGRGIDAAGCGAPTSPCRSFQFVHDNIIAAGGEIDVLDPAGYGAVTITKSLSIVNDGVGLAGVQQPTAGQNAITISAGAGDRIHLRGLGVDGLVVAPNGIVVNSADSVEIVNCVVRRFTFDGIRVQPSSGTLNLFITDVLASGNGAIGILVVPGGSATVNGLVKRATLNNNSRGMSVGGITTSGRADMTVLDSTAAGNAKGFVAESRSDAANTTLFLDHVASTNNNDGLSTTNLAVARITRSSFTRNVTGVKVTGSSTVRTFGDNVIDGNTTEINGALTPVAQQ